jgi:acetyl esterase/lipase
VLRDLVLGLLATAVGVTIGLGSSARAQNTLLSYRDILSRGPPLADRRIAYGADPNQFGELWMPSSPRRARVVVIVHGGCWQAALPGLELMNGLAADLRRRGYAVWNIEYRRLGSPGGGYPGTFDDVGRAIDFLRVIARTDHLDLGHVVVLGHSAGGHLALWAAGRARLPASSPLRTAQPLRIGGVVTLAGINDLAAYRASGPDACGGPTTIDQLVGADRRPADSVYLDTSPVDLLPIGARQTIVSGSLDPIVPERFGHDYAVAARARGDDAEELVLPRAGHFELIDPLGPDWKTIARAVRRLARAHWRAQA